ncbi:MAG: ankyrin repeat domain-containing protein [Phycisphaeraceae bacterium]
MRQPDALKRDEPLLWSPGCGVDVWAMFCACVEGDVAAINRLLDKDPALVRCHYAYRTPIYFSVRENRLAVTELLLERGADPLSLAVNDSLVQIARDRGYDEMLALLERSLRRLHGSSSRGEPIAAAIRARDLPRVRAMLDDVPELLAVGDARGNAPIHWAVMTRQIELIDELLARGADVNARRFDGARPVQLTNGDYHYRGWRDVPRDVTVTPADVVAHLRQRGADVDICTAAHAGDFERVKALLEQDPGLANRPSEYVTYYVGSGTPLRNAAATGDLRVVELLLEHGADPNLPEEGIAPRGHALYAAAAAGHLEVARLLLDRGAYPNPPVESSADALTRAIDRGDEAMVELLCSYGAARSVEILAHYGDVRTAAAVFDANPALADDPEGLASAAGQGHASFVRLMLRHQPNLARRTAVVAATRDLTELLLAHGMNLNQPDWLGITLLHELARRGDRERAEVLLDHGADVHVRDEEICSTPLGWAAKFGQLEMARLLLDRGARSQLPEDPSWATPLAWASRRGHAQVAELLRGRGATA